MAASSRATLLPNDEELTAVENFAQKLFTPIQIGRSTKRYRSKFAAAGSLDKELRIFTRDEGGAEHVMADAPSAAIQTICDWFAKKL
jgi:hypothetical protein